MRFGYLNIIVILSLVYIKKRAMTILINCLTQITVIDV